jgi:RNA polymerase sigma factor (sigma-70 family)
MALDEQLTVFAAVHGDLIDPARPDAYEEAWRRFCRCNEPKIRGWAAAMKLNAGQIDEITGRVMAKLVKATRTYQRDPERSFSAWLRAVVRNEVRDFWSSSVRRPGGLGLGGSDARDALEQQADADVDAEADAATDVLVADLDEQAGERDAKVRRAIAQVRGRVQEQTWEIFELTALRNRPGKEVAEQTGRTIAAVHMARSRVAAMLREELARLGVEP